jgi:CTP-dependent riboflavin kinase
MIEGVLRDGLRVAAQFTELPWVREQFQRKLGLDVWPGTVNLQVQDPDGRAALARLRQAPDAPGGIRSGVPIEPPAVPASAEAPGADQPAYCVGYCFPALIGSLPAAVVVPHVADYPPDKLELVAAVRVRDALGMQPGDRVVVTVLESAEALTPAPLPGGEGLSNLSGGEGLSGQPGAALSEPTEDGSGGAGR